MTGNEVDYYDVQLMIEHAVASEMTGNEVDYYDVQRMIEDAVLPLRSELNQLRAELEAERDHRRESVEAIGRVVSSRTDHLA